MIISDWEPETKEELMNWHSESQKQDFNTWKRNLQEYGRGCKSLVANLDNSNKFENFMEFLAEFNVARILRMHNVEFEYEPKGYEDFLLSREGFEISVKSVMLKNYQIQDKKTYFELKKLAVQDGITKTRTIDYRHSQVYFRVEPSGAWERIETNKSETPGHVLASEMQQKSTLIKYIKKFDQKSSVKKKIMFFMIQNDDCPPILFLETFYYYYKGVAMEHDQSPYDEYFGGDLKRDIAGFVFFYRPKEILCWDAKCLSDSNPAREGGEVYRFNVFAPEDVSGELNRIFK